MVGESRHILNPDIISIIFISQLLKHMYSWRIKETTASVNFIHSIIIV